MVLSGLPSTAFGNEGKLFEIYPLLNHANLCKPRNSVNQKLSEKKKPSTAEQANLYRKLLYSGKVKKQSNPCSQVWGKPGFGGNEE